MDHGIYGYMPLHVYLDQINITEEATRLGTQHKHMLINGWDRFLNNMDEDQARNLVKIFYGNGDISLDEFQNNICYGNSAINLPDGGPYLYAEMHDKPISPMHNQTTFFYQPNYQNSSNVQNYDSAYYYQCQYQNQDGYYQASSPLMQTQFNPPANYQTTNNVYYNQQNGYAPYYYQPQQYAPQMSFSQIPYHAEPKQQHWSSASSMRKGPHHVIVQKDILTTPSQDVIKEESATVDSDLKLSEKNQDVAPISSKSARGKNPKGKKGSVNSVVKIAAKVTTDSQEAKDVQLPVSEIQELNFTKELEKLDFIIILPSKLPSCQASKPRFQAKQDFQAEKVDSSKKAKTSSVKPVSLGSKLENTPSNSQQSASSGIVAYGNEKCASQRSSGITQIQSKKSLTYSDILKKNNPVASTSPKDEKIQAKTPESQKPSLGKSDPEESLSDVGDGWMTQKIKKSKNRDFLPTEVKRFRIIDTSRKFDNENENETEENGTAEVLKVENSPKKKNKRGRNGRRFTRNKREKERMSRELDEKIEESEGKMVSNTENSTKEEEEEETHVESEADSSAGPQNKKNKVEKEETLTELDGKMEENVVEIALISENQTKEEEEEAHVESEASSSADSQKPARLPVTLKESKKKNTCNGRQNKKNKVKKGVTLAELERIMDEKVVEIASITEHQEKDEKVTDVESETPADPTHDDKLRVNTRWIIVEMEVKKSTHTCELHPNHQRTVSLFLKPAFTPLLNSLDVCELCASDPIALTQKKRVSLFISVAISIALEYDCNFLNTDRLATFLPYLEVIESCIMVQAFGLDLYPRWSGVERRNNEMEKVSFLKKRSARNGIATFVNFKHFLAGFDDLVKKWQDPHLIEKMSTLVDKIIEKYLAETNNGLMDACTKELIWTNMKLSKNHIYQQLILYTIRKKSEINMDFLSYLFLFESNLL